MHGTASDPTVLVVDRIDAARVAALHATLGRKGPSPSTGDPLPPFWHWIQFWDAQPPDSLGRDGHPGTGTGLIPDLGLPRRMWAGGDVRFHTPLVIGERAERESEVTSVTRKTGRSGPLGFVTLTHRLRQQGTLCVTEVQDLVYREEAPAAAEPGRPPRPPDPAPEQADKTRRHRATTTQLFRYSALTFNGHRIHYDLDYARSVEGYDGLVVHGPLLAQHLIDLGTEMLGSVTRFRFRALAPVIHDQPFEARGRKTDEGADLWIARGDGALAMRATAT
ncbi:MAG: MaoC family dehydratase N-terminal domain-containing protein [Pseudomonadota bacterium]